MFVLIYLAPLKALLLGALVASTVSKYSNVVPPGVKKMYFLDSLIHPGFPSFSIWPVVPLTVESNYNVVGLKIYLF